MVVGTLAFVRPLYGLVVYASDNELNSHAPLIPIVAGYLLLTKRGTLPRADRTSFAGALLLCAISAVALAAAIVRGPELSLNDALTLKTLAYVTFVAAGGFLFLGPKWMAAAAFPVAFLIFMVPLPDAAVAWLEQALVAGSADVAALFFKATGTPFFRNGTVFALPTIVFEVARECSGIRSSWVLLITSLAASQMFLNSPWRRAILVLFVIPLGIARNAFRILVIGLLCVHVGPHMIDSVIHHRGGPIFFLLSLIPLFMLLFWLKRGEKAR
jgi:exosortase C (VPDSG-CTERM-specific)